MGKKQDVYFFTELKRGGDSDWLGTKKMQPW